MFNYLLIMVIQRNRTKRKYINRGRDEIEIEEEIGTEMGERKIYYKELTHFDCGG